MKRRQRTRTKLQTWARIHDRENAVHLTEMLTDLIEQTMLQEDGSPDVFIHIRHDVDCSYRCGKGPCDCEVLVHTIVEEVDA